MLNTLKLSTNRQTTFITAMDTSGGELEIQFYLVKGRITN